MKYNGKMLISLSVFLFISSQGISQSIGYAISYTAPYTFDKSSVDFTSLYSKGSEVSAGLVFRNNSNMVNSGQLRLTRYTSFLNYSQGTFLGFRETEAKVTKYLFEFEGYLISKVFKNGMSIGLGAKFSVLLKSNQEGFVLVNGIESSLRESNFEGSSRFKSDLLFKFNWNKLRLSDNLELQPSYVFGYGLTGDFKVDNVNSSSLSHRFELILFKKLSLKKGE